MLAEEGRGVGVGRLGSCPGLWFLIFLCVIERTSDEKNRQCLKSLARLEVLREAALPPGLLGVLLQSLLADHC